MVVRQNATIVLQVARYLAVSSRSDCGRRGFEALLADPQVPMNQQWGAVLGLYSHLVAKGRFREVRELLASDVAKKLGADILYLLPTEHPTGLEENAREVARRLGADYATLGAPFLWALGSWAIQQGDDPVVIAVARALRAKADSTKSRRDALLAAAFAGHAALARGDSLMAERLLSTLKPNAPPADLEWQPWESLGLERLVLAKLLYARAEYVRAADVAAQFDSPQPVIYPVYLAASLTIRLEAARALGKTETVNSCERRLAVLRR
jgi:hypothetical protein